jgi:hypothetical protein
VLAANLDGDRCTDLLVGVPGLTVDGQPEAGGVQIFYGTPTGFEAGPLLTSGSNGVAGVATPREDFGASLAESTGTSGTGAGQLVEVGIHIGAPGATVTADSKNFHSAGTVVEVDFDQVPGARLGAPTASTEMWQGNGIGGSPVVGAHLGAVMSDRLVAAPDETLSHRRIAAGFVSRANYAFDTAPAHTGLAPLVIDGQDVGGHLGAGLNRLCGSDSALIGAPGRHLSRHAQAGDVLIVKNLDKAPKIVGHLNQNVSHIPGKVGSHHEFGAALSSACDVVHEQPVIDIAIGVPGTTVGGHLRAGAVVLLQVAPRKVLHILADRLLNRTSKRVVGTPGGGDGFGATVQSGSSGGHDQVLVGAPYDDLAAMNDGSVDQLSVRLTTLRVAHSTLLHRKHGNDNDNYGAALAQ